MGLRTGDLSDLVYKVFEIDCYKSKMGDDSDIIVLSFTVTEKAAAEDLVAFVERGYNFVLDADYSAIESDFGDHRVFVEIDRDADSIHNIVEIMDGISKLANITDFRFRYYKSFKTYDLTPENLEAEIPTTDEDYNQVVKLTNMNNFKNFFDKSYLESIDLHGETITFKKIWANPITFEIVDFSNDATAMDNITESFNFKDFGELIFLSKYIGDYNISKYGDNLVFENRNAKLILKRI